MSVLNIVLVEPQIPQNTGNIARTCAATGARLHLVEPRGFKVDNAKLKRAGLDYWHLLDITYYADLNDFFEKNKDGKFFYFQPRQSGFILRSSISIIAILFSAKKRRGCPRSCFLKIRKAVCVCR